MAIHSLPFPIARANLSVRPFEARVTDEEIDQLKQLISLSPLPSASYETTSNSDPGLSLSFLQDAKDCWLNHFDWRSHENVMNEFSNFIAAVPLATPQDPQATIDIHFVALFSESPNAIPLVFLHGFPSSPFEFLPLLQFVKQQYPDPQKLPHHIVIPSLPGYANSATPPKDVPFDLDMAAQVIDNLMTGLGFTADKGGYIAQGGDLGSFIARALAAPSPQTIPGRGPSRALQRKYPACRAIHVNQMDIPRDFTELLASKDELDSDDSALVDTCMNRIQVFQAHFSHLFALQAAHPSTVASICASSPLSLLSWIGGILGTTSQPLDGQISPSSKDKKIPTADWKSTEMSLPDILQTVTLYWFTQTMSRGGLWHSRAIQTNQQVDASLSNEPASAEQTQSQSSTLTADRHVRNETTPSPNTEHAGIPVGYSLFANDVLPIPRAWAARQANLVYFKYHGEGGHFPGRFHPARLWNDVEEFVRVVTRDETPAIA